MMEVRTWKVTISRGPYWRGRGESEAEQTEPGEGWQEWKSQDQGKALEAGRDTSSVQPAHH